MSWRRRCEHDGRDRACRPQSALPLSLAQQRSGFLDQSQVGQRGYHLSAALRLLGNLDVCSAPATLIESLRARRSAHAIVLCDVRAVPGDRAGRLRLALKRET